MVIFENGQGRGSLNCDTSSSYSGDKGVHANANDERHSFLYLVNTLFRDPRVSSFLLDPVRDMFIGAADHVSNGYRKYEDVSYPCFTTAGGHRVELREGIWQGTGYSQNLRLINVPVLKHHEGSEITASLKHLYGVLSMSDGNSNVRHYGGLGNACGKMMVSVRTPVLNILDAVWVSYSSLKGYPANTTYRANQILASQDPVALDYWGAKYIIYPIDDNANHNPDSPVISQWLSDAETIVNERGGLFDAESGIMVGLVTKDEAKIVSTVFLGEPGNQFLVSSPNGGEAWVIGTSRTIGWTYTGNPGPFVRIELLKGGKVNRLVVASASVGSDGGGSYTWEVPATQKQGNDYAIRVTSTQDGSIKDASDAYFTINGPQPGITVTSPNGAETWQVKSARTIRWTYAGSPGPYVRIELLKGGQVNRVITPNASLGSHGSGSYTWRVASYQQAGNDYAIRITSTRSTSITDTSDTFFTITK